MRKQEIGGRRRGRRRRSFTLLVGILTLVPGLFVHTAVSAQTDSARVSGFVRDQNKGIVQGAKVTVKTSAAATSEPRAPTSRATKFMGRASFSRT